MVEAVSVAASNAPIIRSNAEPVDVAQASAISPAKVEASASLPQGPYVSPYIYVDQNFHKAVTQIRDSSTGKVIGQFPSEQQLNIRHYQAEHASVESPPSASKAPSPATVTSAAPAATTPIATAVVSPQGANAGLAQAASAALTSVATTGEKSGSINITA